jgi:nicotinamidase-related amidase
LTTNESMQIFITMRSELPFQIEIENSALIVVDMQNDFVRPDAPLAVPDALNTINSIKEVKHFFNKAGRPVIFTRFIAGPKESLLWTWSPEIREPINCCKLGFVRHYEDIQSERECVGIIDELEVSSGDYIVDKYWYGAFFRTNIQDILASTGTTSVVVAGTVTQICVEETARQAFHHGYRTTVLSDCVSSFDSAMHAATLKNLNMKFGVVMDSKDYLELVGN